MTRVRSAAIPFGTFLAIIGAWSIWLELGREQFRMGNAVIGGPDGQAIFGSSILAAVGVALIIWGMTRRR